MSTDPAREAAARAAAERVEPGMTLGLGSGRAVWRTIELIAERWPGRPPVRSAFASDKTAALAAEHGIEPVELDGDTRLDLAIDGADEIAPGLALIKGGGAALLREKIVVQAASRFVVVAEERKLVSRLGETFKLPVEVVRFGWQDTRRRVLDLVPSADLRTGDDQEPVITDEGHHLLDCELHDPSDPAALGQALKSITGVVEHGLFVGLAHEALVGRPDGSVQVVSP